MVCATVVSSMRSASFFALAVLLSTACDVRVNDKGVSIDLARGKATDEWMRTYTIASGGRLEIVNTNGAFEVGPAAGTVVTVRAMREARGDSDEAAKALLAGVEMVGEVTPHPR